MESKYYCNSVLSLAKTVRVLYCVLKVVSSLCLHDIVCDVSIPRDLHQASIAQFAILDSGLKCRTV